MEHFIIEGQAPLKGTIEPSGNKNEALPALMSCLLTDEEIILNNMPKIQDVKTTCSILMELGVNVEWISDTCLKLHAPKT